MAVTSDDFAHGQIFKVTLDGDGLKEESHFREASGLDVYIDCVEVQEVGKNDGAHKRPGAARYSHIVLKRGMTASPAFFKWVSNAVNRNVQRMSGKVALCRIDGAPVMEWSFEKGWPCRYEGPKFDAENNVLALETVEIAHEGLKMHPGGDGAGAKQG